MFADSTFLWLDTTAWTAIAAIVAAILGLTAVLQPKLTSWFSRPDLNFNIGALNTSCTWVDSRLYIRIPVSNAFGRNSAKQVEIFVERIHDIQSEYEVIPPSFLPVRLTWTHGNEASCDRIAGGAQRLLDIGHIEFFPNTDSGLGEAVDGSMEGRTPTTLHVLTEVPSRHPFTFPVGTFSVDFILVCDSGYPQRRTLEFTLTAVASRVGVERASTYLIINRG